MERAEATGKRRGWMMSRGVDEIYVGAYADCRLKGKIGTTATTR